MPLYPPASTSSSSAPYWQLQALAADYTIPANSAGIFVGGLTMQNNKAITVPAGSYLYVMN